MFNKYFRFFYFLLFISSLSAQDLPNIIPPSPNAYELGKFGLIDVGMFTGTPNISVPIYNYKTKNLSIPISLNYSSNGVKVDDIATWVGLGWTLNAGGVITRIVRDLPDEKNPIRVPPRELTLSNQWDSDIIDFARSVAEVSNTERDLFMFNFNGYTGRFTIDDDGLILTPPFQGLKIKLTNSHFGTSSNFEITTPDGVKYLFADKEVTNTYDDMIVNTAWYLSKVSHPNGDVINFTYEAESYRYNLGITQTYTKNTNLGGGGCPPGEAQCPANGLNTSYNYTKIYGLRIKEISSNSSVNGKVVFDKGIETPLGHNTYKYLLGQINILNSENKLIEKFKLDHQLYKERAFLTSVNFLDSSKIYIFDYNNPDDLPSRLSYSQDYWGYYNGKVNFEFYPKLIEEPFFSQEGGGNREPNGSEAIKGLLKKITYPTKGTTELIYEPNIIQDEAGIQYSIKSVTHTIDDNNKENYFFTTPSNLHSDQICSMMIRSTERGEFPCVGVTDFNADDPGNSIWLSAQLFDMTSNSYVVFNTNSTFLQNNQGMIPLGVTFNLSPNHQYRLELEKGSNCIAGSAYIQYVTKTYSQEIVDREIGGLRIKKTINKASDTATEEVKRYYYGNKEHINISSASEGDKGYYIYPNTVQLICGNNLIAPYPKNCEYLNLTSSSVDPLFYNNYNTPYYEYVTISNGGDDFENGGEENQYIITKNSLGETVFSEYIHIPNINVFSNTGWDNGLLKKTTIFKKNELNEFENLKVNESFYKNDSRNTAVNVNYKVSERWKPAVFYDEYPVEQINIVKYTDNSYWHYLDRTITTEYNLHGNDSLKTTTNYTYDNPQHLQLTSTKITDSKNNIINVKHYYPEDKESLSNLTTASSIAIDSLIAQHRINNPIQTETSVTNASGLELSKTTVRTNFKDWGINFSGINHIISPEKVETSKNSDALEERLVYHHYDDKGNPVEVSKKDGAKIYYVWGYDQTQPIAKIEGYTTFSTAVTTLINAAISLSNNDDDHTIGTTGNEGALRRKLEDLRVALPEAQVTSFTYDPLVGVTSVIDPRGYVIYYKYDSFNRLEFVKDADGNILSENKYNYKQ